MALVLDLRLGIRLVELREPTKKALHTAARLGAAGVEIDVRRQMRPAEWTDTAVRHFRKMLDDLGLRLAALAYPTRRGYEVEEDLERRIDGTRAAMRLAYRLGAGRVVNHIGSVPDPESASTPWSTLRQSLSELARFGEREGAVLAALTGDVPIESIRRLREELPEGALRLAIDPGELVMHRIDPVAYLAELGRDLEYAYLSDGVRDASRGRGVAVPIGRGSVDLPAVLGALEERGYHGFLTIRSSGSDQPLEELDHAVAYIRALFQ